tara:strand:+ start:1272 stop:1616 length:345 start_codon:yes stop_codon:yes gene_type:complete
MLEKFALPVLVTFFTVLITWFFARKKNKAETISVVKTNDSTEIENLLKMVKEWRETATNWKDLADSYQKELIECRKINGTKLEELYKEIRGLKTQLSKSNKRILELEKHDGQQA